MNAEASHSTPFCSGGQCSIRPPVVTPLPHSFFASTSAEIFNEFLSAVGAGWCGSHLAKGGYQLMHGGFFPVKEQFDTLFDADQVSLMLEQ
jgi:hypothetical protein